MARKSGASKGAKKIDAFNDRKLEGVNISQRIPSVSILEQMKSGKALDKKFTEKYKRDKYGNRINPPSNIYKTP